MNILIVEDDQTKIEDLQKALADESEMLIASICKSYQSGLKRLFALDIDVVILDMTLPLYDESGAGGGGRKVQFGGELVLQEMMEEGITSKVIIFSQHDYFADLVTEVTLFELGERLNEKFSEILVDTVLYDSSDFGADEKGWRRQLLNALNKCRK